MYWFQAFDCLEDEEIAAEEEGLTPDFVELVVEEEGLKPSDYASRVSRISFIPQALLEQIILQLFN